MLSLPDTASSEFSQGTVLAVGFPFSKDASMIDPKEFLKEGDLVAYRKYTNSPLELSSGQKIDMVHFDHITAIL